MSCDDPVRRQFLDDAWRRAAGRPERADPGARASVDELSRSEWSPEFEAAMRRRLIFGAYRYGCLGAPGKPRYDRVASIRKRLALYEESGNLELLVDCAHLLLLEFVEGDHPKKHFAASDDGEHVGERK